MEDGVGGLVQRLFFQIEDTLTEMLPGENLCGAPVGKRGVFAQNIGSAGGAVTLDDDDVRELGAASALLRHIIRGTK